MLRLFAHRGLHSKNVLQNSVSALEAAYKNGFRAVEFDIWFLEGKLVLKHNKPLKSEIKKLPEFFEYLAYKNKITYWCDFKNLNEKNCKAAMILLKSQLQENGIELDRVYFAPYITNYNLAHLVFAKIREVFGKQAQLVAVCDKEDRNNLRRFLSENNIKFLSIFHKLLDKFFMKVFVDIEIFAWTLNDIKTLQSLENIGVRNFATDKITPQIYDRSQKLSRT